MNKETIKNYYRRGVSAAITTVGAAAMCSPMAYAGAFDGLQNNLNSLFTDAATMLKTIATPIAIAALIFCLVMMFFSNNQQKVSSYRDWAIRIVIIVAVIYAAEPIVNMAKSLGGTITA